MKRALLAALAAAAAFVPGALAAASPVKIAAADTTAYPHMVVSVVTAHPVQTPPALSENGVRVAGFQAVNLGAAKSIVLAIDNSRSMGGASLRDATAAARAFVDSKSPSDRVSVMAFGHEALQLTGFTTSTPAADGALTGLAVDPTQGTALYDVVAAAANALGSSARAGRVIVLLTDGRDVSSTTSLHQAIAAARSAGASVYSIGIESSSFDPSTLRALAAATGGTYRGAGSSLDLQRVYASISSELKRTWRLDYDTTARPGDELQLRAVVPGVGVALQRVTVPVTPGGAPDNSTGMLPAAAYSPAGTIVVSAVVALLLLAALLSVVRIRRGSWVKQRLAAHVGEARRRAHGQGQRLSFLKALFKATEGALGRRSQWRLIERMLVRGDIPLRPAEFVWLSIACGIGIGFVFAAAGAPSLLTLVAMAFGGSLPYVFVAFRVRRRARAFENQLPDLLTTIAASLKAGHSFKHGLQAVVEESQPPANLELQRVLNEAGLGRPLDLALADMAERVGSENFAFAITAVTIQRQVGGSLASLFDMVSETVRNRQQFARKIRSLTAMGRMSAYTLIGIPFFITGMISLTNASYMHPLFHTHLGHMLLLAGLLGMAFGSFLLQKIVSFKG